MADLVPIADLKAFLGPTPAGDDALLGDLTLVVQAQLEADCSRHDAPFADAATGRVEVKDGTGREQLWLDYPVAAVTAVLIGENFAAPDETLTVADPTVLLVVAGSRRLVRRDGGTFGEADSLGTVKVTYDTQADLPKAAKLAVMRGVAMVYRQRGSEDAKSEQVGGYSTELAQLLRSDGAWMEAVQTLSRVIL